MTTVVLCGSLGSSSAMWDAQLPALSAHDLVLVDHPGHGGAPLADVWGVADLARRVPGERFSLVGLSLGGAVGMWLALHEPERIEKLVLVSTSARFGDPAMWEERAATVRADGLEAIVDTVLARWFTPSFRETPQAKKIAELIANTPVAGYVGCGQAIMKLNTTARLKDIKLPVLAVTGEADAAAAGTRYIGEHIPGAKFVNIAQAAHITNLEQAEKFNQALRDFL